METAILFWSEKEYAAAWKQGNLLRRRLNNEECVYFTTFVSQSKESSVCVKIEKQAQKIKIFIIFVQKTDVRLGWKVCGMHFAVLLTKKDCFFVGFVV